jgi:hypothetical protein
MKFIDKLTRGKSCILTAMLWLACHPTLVEAGVLSRGVCRPYKQLVDNELFVVVTAIAGAILVVVWKLSPSGQLLARGVGLMAALAVALNIENLVQTISGVGLLC